MVLEDTEFVEVTVPGRVVRVLIDVPAIDKTFDYLLPDSLVGASDARLGTIVRVPLHGRRVGAWVVGINVEPAVSLSHLVAVTKVSSVGPPRELLSLAKWAAWRWWGRPATFLQIASPQVTVRGLPPVRAFDPTTLAAPVAEAGLSGAPGATVVGIDISQFHAALRNEVPSVVRLPPLSDPFPLVLEAVRVSQGRGLLVLAPQVATAQNLARRFRRAGIPVALVPDEWARAALPGSIVIGARSAAWAPCASFGAVIMLDEHDEAYQDERAPTWHAREVVIERARRLGSACLLFSPVPSPHALAVAEGRVLVPDRRHERDGWPIVELLDRTDEEPGRVPIVAPGLTKTLRSGGRVFCVLNRTGRAKLLDCRTCGALAECERCGAALNLPSHGTSLVCGRCAQESPIVCRACGGGRLRQLRPGTTRLRDDLEALAQRPVIEIVGSVTSSDATPGAPGADVRIGTEAVLHRSGRAEVVVFLDIDGELLAPRMRSTDSVVALVVRAARVVGASGRVILVTRQPTHVVLRALSMVDVDGLERAQVSALAALGYAPPAAVAVVTGIGATDVGEPLRSVVEAPGSLITRLGPLAGPFVVRAPSIDALADALSDVPRPSDRVRVEIDPVRW